MQMCLKIQLSHKRPRPSPSRTTATTTYPTSGSRARLILPQLRPRRRQSRCKVRKNLTTMHRKAEHALWWCNFNFVPNSQPPGTTKSGAWLIPKLANHESWFFSNYEFFFAIKNESIFGINPALLSSSLKVESWEQNWNVVIIQHAHCSISIVPFLHLFPLPLWSPHPLYQLTRLS